VKPFSFVPKFLGSCHSVRNENRAAQAQFSTHRVLLQKDMLKTLLRLFFRRVILCIRVTTASVSEQPRASIFREDSSPLPRRRRQCISPRRQSLALVNNQLDALFSMYLFHFSTCFEQPSARHPENQLYQYIIWYMSLWQMTV
jgi:hypothetical protein